MTILDGVCNDFTDLDRLAVEVRAGAGTRLRRQVADPSRRRSRPCNAAFSPDAWTRSRKPRRSIAAFAEPDNAGKGALRIEGKMVERLHLAEAEAHPRAGAAQSRLGARVVSFACRRPGAGLLSSGHANHVPIRWRLIGNTPARPPQGAERGERVRHLRQVRIHQSRRLGEGSCGAVRSSRMPRRSGLLDARRHDRRGDRGQYRDRDGAGRQCQGLQDDHRHARDAEPRENGHAACARRASW